MGDWQPGDLALCVKQGRWRVHGRYVGSRGMRAGVVARVRGVGFSPSGTLTLWMEGWPGDRFLDGFGAKRFRRIPPHTPDAEDRETIRLLTGAPVLEPADLRHGLVDDAADTLAPRIEQENGNGS